MKGDFGREWFVNAVSTSCAINPKRGCGVRSVREYILGDRLLQKSRSSPLSNALTSVLIRWSDNDVWLPAKTQSPCIMPIGLDSPYPSLLKPSPLIFAFPFLTMILTISKSGNCCPDTIQSDWRLEEPGALCWTRVMYLSSVELVFSKYTSRYPLYWEAPRSR